MASKEKTELKLLMDNGEFVQIRYPINKTYEILKEIDKCCEFGGLQELLIDDIEIVYRSNNADDLWIRSINFSRVVGMR